MNRTRQSHRPGKASVVLICVVTGVVCLVLGGICGGGLTMVFAVRPVERQMRELSMERDAAAAASAGLGKAAQVVEGMLTPAIPTGQTGTSGTQASETTARTVFENIRAGRPQALFKRCSMDFRQTTMPDNIQQQLAKYPLPPRTEAIGDELETLPPIDESTHQYRCTTKSTNGKSVTFTTTLVFGSPNGYGSSEWILDQLTIGESTAENDLRSAPASP